MEPITYGETIALHLEELRREAARERAARQMAGNRPVAGWRVWTGRLLVSTGERVAGCAELARGETKPVARVLG